MANRPPKNRVIRISLDHDHQFHYTDLFDGQDAGAIKLIKGDRLAWVLDAAISPRTFQLDFDEVNPFQLGSPVSLRGTDMIVAPDLDFPFITYSGNRILKYSVCLGNGWHDDPDIVPSPGDPVLGGQHFLPSALITWVDASTQKDIYLNPPDMSADATDGGGTAPVTWSWQGDQPNMQPFTVQFDQNAVPPGWPAAPQDSVPVNKVPMIQLYLPQGFNTATAFTLSTTDRDGNPIDKPGTLLVS